MSASKLRQGALAVVLAATVLAAGCNASSPDSQAAAHATPTGAVATCGLDGATGFVLPVPGGVPVEAESVGTGNLAVVLSHEWEQSPCPWAEVATRVAANGYRAVIWEYGELTGLDRVKELQAI